ncbi:MAG: hypothetical protein V1253_08700, partial [Alphaproteobacteria bacterium]|nr:hypothetical protein [Alphaproteobacteria bacterium]
MKRIMIVFATAAAVAVFSIISGANGVLAADTQALEQQIQQMQQDLNRLMNELRAVKEEQAHSAEIRAAAKAEAKAKEDFKVSTKGGIKVESGDGNFKALIGGRIMADAAWFDEDKTNMGDGTEFRRARLHLAGTMFKDWHFK